MRGTARLDRRADQALNALSLLAVKIDELILAAISGATQLEL